MAFIDSGNLLIIKDDSVIFNVFDGKQVYRGTNYYITNRQYPDFVSIVTDKTANTNSGKLYIASSDGFYIIDLNKKEVVDVITKTHSKVSVKDKLKQEDIVDLNIGGNPSLA